ncbi:MAG TPA: tetratricopeptide repeat protein [Candidatus Methanoperedens sp.]
MPEDNKTKEFLQKIAPCIERGEPDACVEEAARLAGEMEIGAEELLDLSMHKGKNEDHGVAYVLALAAAQGLEGKKKARAHSNAGVAMQFLKRLDKSEEQYKLAIAADPKYASAHYNYAILLNELNRKQDAEEQYKLAIATDSNDASAHYNYAILLNELNRKQDAEEQYKLAIAANPKDSSVHNNYANLLREKAQFYDAEKEVRIALQISPNNPYAFGTLGDILADEGCYEDALKEYQKSLENSSSMTYSSVSEIHNNLGWVHAQLKQYTKAEEAFKKARAFDSMNVKAIRNLRVLGKVKAEPAITKMQACLATLPLLSLIVSFYLFWIGKLSETVFATQSTLLISLLIFILFYHQLSKFKAGPIEFEKSTEHRNQPAEAISKIER